MGKKELVLKCETCEENLCVTRVPIFAHLAIDELQKVSSLIKRRNFKAGETILSTGEEIKGLYILRYGSIKMVRYTREGDEILFEVLGRGDFYGGDNFFRSARASEEMIALEDSGICFISEKDLEKIIMENPEIAIKIIQVLSTMQSDDRNMISILSEKDALKRIGLFLLWQTENGNNFIDMTQDELAKRISLTHETVSRRMKELREAGYVAMHGYGKIELKNREGLSFFMNY